MKLTPQKPKGWVYRMAEISYS